MAYVDYDFYLNTYFGNVVSEENFPRLSERASDYIRAATRGISDKVDGWQLDAVKKASCAIADVLLDEEIMAAGAFSGEQAVSSETVGGWSRSYRSAPLASADVEYIEKRKRDALLLYLGNLPAFVCLGGSPCPPPLPDPVTNRGGALSGAKASGSASFWALIKSSRPDSSPSFSSSFCSFSKAVKARSALLELNLSPCRRGITPIATPTAGSSGNPFCFGLFDVT